MSHSLNSKGVIQGIIGEYYRGYEGDTGSVGYRPYRILKEVDITPVIGL